MTHDATRSIAATIACGFGSAMCWFAASSYPSAHGSEARLVRELAWKKPRIVRAIATNRSELGLSGSKVPADVQTVAGRSCVVGPLIAFDVDDAYAFDIDEPVDVTLAEQWRVQLPQLRPRVDEADQRYRQLLDRWHAILRH